MSSSLSKLFALTSSDRNVALGATTLFLFVRLSLNLVGLNRSLRLLDRLSPLRPSPTDTDPTHRMSESERISALVNTVARRMFHGRAADLCLPKSLVTRMILRRRGLDGKLRIGVKPGEGTLRAHAWVEVGGVALSKSDRQGEFVLFTSTSFEDV
ncbi:MAG: lasso peptide biosynthesis B2 protein [Rhodothermales bacterium]